MSWPDAFAVVGIVWGVVYLFTHINVSFYPPKDKP